MSRTFSVIVLAGGSSRRLHGLDKTAVSVNGRSFLDRVLSFWPLDAPRIVVGPSRETEAPVTWCREDPPGGGPVSALAAALPLVTTDLVALVGADMPLLGPAVGQLVVAATTAVDEGQDGAWLTMMNGQPQPLASCVHVSTLKEAMPVVPAGRPLMPIFRGLDLMRVPVLDELLLDADTEDDLGRVVQVLSHQDTHNESDETRQKGPPHG